jgi:replication-associated recombination protein RarA
MILYGGMRERFDYYFSLDKADVSHLYLVGTSGLGKSTIARLIRDNFDWSRRSFFDGNDTDKGKKDRARFVQNFSTTGTGIEKVLGLFSATNSDSSRARELWQIDEFQNFTDDEQRSINSGLEDRYDDVCLVATGNSKSKGGGVGSSTLSRMDVINFSDMVIKKNDDRLTEEMLRLTRRIMVKNNIALDIFTDDEIRNMALKQSTSASGDKDFRVFFRYMDRTIGMKQFKHD